MSNSADLGQLASLQKPTDLDLHYLQSKGISGFSRTRVKQDVKKVVSLVKTNRETKCIQFPLPFM